jgi:hypothetical protein
LFGKNAPRSPEWHRLTDLADLLGWANWQRGGSPRNKEPEPLPRPNPRAGRGDEDDLDELEDDDHD